jgi:hypothetical protein
MSEGISSDGIKLLIAWLCGVRLDITHNTRYDNKGCLKNLLAIYLFVSYRGRFVLNKRSENHQYSACHVACVDDIRMPAPFLQPSVGTCNRISRRDTLAAM